MSLNHMELMMEGKIAGALVSYWIMGYLWIDITLKKGFIRIHQTPNWKLQHR